MLDWVFLPLMRLVFIGQTIVLFLLNLICHFVTIPHKYKKKESTKIFSYIVVLKMSRVLKEIVSHLHISCKLLIYHHSVDMAVLAVCVVKHSCLHSNVKLNEVFF